MGKCKYCEYFIPDGASRCGHCGTYQKYRGFRNNFSAFWVITTMIMAGLIWFQSCSITDQSVDIKNQTDAIKAQTDIPTQKFSIENRPYFYVVLEPIADLRPANEETKSLVAGVFAYYGNFGNHYVKDLKVLEYELYADSKAAGILTYSDAIKKYWEDEFGGHLEFNSVPPKQKIGPLDYRAGMETFKKNQRKYVQFSIRTEYKGHRDKKYKYGADCVYILEYIDNRMKGNQFIPLILHYKQYFVEAGEKLPEMKCLISEYKGKARK